MILLSCQLCGMFQPLHRCSSHMYPLFCWATATQVASQMEGLWSYYEVGGEGLSCWLPGEVAWDWGICESKDQLKCPLWHVRVTHGSQTTMALHLLWCNSYICKVQMLTCSNQLFAPHWILANGVQSFLFFFNGERYHLSLCQILWFCIFVVLIPFQSSLPFKPWGDELQWVCCHEECSQKHLHSFIFMCRSPLVCCLYE